MISSNRIVEIDIVKALAIILVVAGHAGTPFTHFIYLFHVAVFFIASGFFYKDTASNTIKSVATFIWKKIKQLWFPFFVWNGFFVLMNNTFIKTNIYTDNPQLLQYVTGNNTTHDYLNEREIIKKIILGGIFKGNTQIGGALWFLAILFMASVAYCISDYIIKRVFKSYALGIQLCWSIVLLIAGYICAVNNISLFGLSKVASIYILYYTGVILGRYKDKYRDYGTSSFLVITAASTLILVILNNIGNVSLANNTYTDPAFLIVASLSGWMLLYSIANLIALTKVKHIFIYIGEKTLSILIFHFLAFKIVALIITKIYDLPSLCIAAFPNLYGNHGLWWVAYIIVGLTVPIAMNNVYSRSIGAIKKIGIITAQKR